MIGKKKLSILILIPLLVNQSICANEKLWQDISVQKLNKQATTKQYLHVSQYRAIRINWDRFNDLIATEDKTITLPMPDGHFTTFMITENSVMAPELAAKFPEIKSYSGIAINDSAILLRLDKNPKGLHAMITGNGLSIYIDPYSMGNVDDHISYHKKDLMQSSKIHCSIKTEDRYQSKVNKGVARSNGETKKTFRLAMAVTGEYTAFHGGTKSAALAAVVTTINRVSGIYERDLSITFVLIGDNDKIIYTNADTDPYTDDNSHDLFDQNQENVTQVIGSANFDIGHVMGTGGGFSDGVADLGSICIDQRKAHGVTGRAQPIGDAFDVDFVAHELGHQLGANHTFNGSGGSCFGGNRNSTTAFEPNSGSTIMAYAGICFNDDLQANSDDNFHLASLIEITGQIASPPGDCGSSTLTNNAIPSVDAGEDYTIPANTPFILTGSASDNDNSDNLSYSWEQFDLGAVQPPNTDDGNRPLFRVFSPVSTGSRTFPKISDLLNQTSTIGEILPTTDRTMNFQLVVRDNHNGTGAYNTDDIDITVTKDAGPFEVTSHMMTSTLTGNSEIDVTWNVANTDQAPVNCDSVDIMLTLNQMTDSTTIISNSANDGLQSVIVPNNIDTTSARIKIKCAENIFFAISKVDLTVQPELSPVNPGDANSDGIINILDVISIINQINGIPAQGNSDCNESGDVDVLDVICAINKFI